MSTSTPKHDNDLVEDDGIGLEVLLRCVNPLIVAGVYIGVEGQTHPYVPALHVVRHPHVKVDLGGQSCVSRIQEFRTGFADRYGVENPEGSRRIFQKTGKRKHEGDAVKNISAGVGGLIGALKSGKSRTESGGRQRCRSGLIPGAVCPRR